MLAKEGTSVVAVPGLCVSLLHDPGNDALFARTSYGEETNSSGQGNNNNNNKKKKHDHYSPICSTAQAVYFFMCTGHQQLPHDVLSDRSSLKKPYDRSVTANLYLLLWSRADLSP